jgi:predicted transcriptional regulator
MKVSYGADHRRIASEPPLEFIASSPSAKKSLFMWRKMELTSKTNHALIIRLTFKPRSDIVMTDIADKTNRDDLLRMAVEVVAAYVSKNPLPAGQIPEVIQTVYTSLASLEGGQPEVKAEAPKPAVPVKRSVTPEHIICLEDGKKLKMLKRHLRTTYNMTPDEYRAKWGLAPDYPMVAPNYAAQRSDFAKKIGLGRKADPEEKVTPRRKGR